MTRGLYFLAHWCARHAKMVVAVWLLFFVAVNGLNNRLAPPGQQEIVLSGTDSATAQTLLNRAFPGVSSDAQPLVIACSYPLAGGSGAELIDRAERTVADVEGVAGVTGPKEQAALLAPDARTAILRVQVSSAYLGDHSTAENLLRAGQESAPDCQVALGGLMGQVLSQVDSRTSEVLGLLAAVIVLMVALRRFAAAVVPLLNAIMAVGCGSAIIALVGRLVFIPDVAPTLGTMLGLGVGIDYALFLVVRHRALLRRGFDVRDSIGRTAGTAGAGMVFAGSTLVLAVCGLALTGISFLAWLGYAAAIVVAVAIASSLTLVPALFALLKYRVLPRRERDLARHMSDDHLDRGVWARIADAVTTRPWPYAIGAVLFLLVLALPVTRMEFGQTDASALPETTTAYQANLLTVEAFGPGFTGPLAIVSQLNRPAQAPEDSAPGSGVDPRTLDPRLVALATSMRQQPGIDLVGDPIVSPDGGVAVIRVTPTTGPTDAATQDLVNHLRDQVLPAATAGADMEAHVGSVTALMMDLSEQIGASLPKFIGGVVLLSACLLLIAYRSIVIPVKAALMNLLSIGAAYGVVVAVFQWGWGAGLLGVDELVPIESYVPMIMFAVLFGLSMDYEVFLLTSFQEHWSRTKDMTVAVRRGLTDTGQVVTSAATIMVVVFASFILIPNAVVKMFGIGLSTAVLVDATVVRCVLVPALMVLAARWTWWLPPWLDRILPPLHVEGDPAALVSIHEPARSSRPGSVHEAITPATPLLPAFFGVLGAWYLGSRVVVTGEGPSYQELAVAIAAVVGGLVVWIPQGMPGAGRAPGARILATLCGALGVAVLYGFLQAVIPFTQQDPGFMAAGALLVVTVIAAFSKAKRYALPVILGGIVMAVTIGLASAEGGIGGLMRVAITPLLLAGFVALVLNRLRLLFGDRTTPPDQPAPAAAESEPVGAVR